MSFREITLNRIDLNRGDVRKLKDEVAVDEAICLFINDEYYTTLIASPNMIKELIVGHLMDEGIVKTLREVKDIDVEPLRVHVELRNELDLKNMMRRRISVITTACGPASAPLRPEQLQDLSISGEARVKAEEIWNMAMELNKRSEVYRRTGGTHSAMLCSIDGSFSAFAEDVGRHNAVDKAIGSGALVGVEMSGCVLICSGRQSGEIVLKAARSGIPIVVSVAGPMESGIRVAQAVGITLVCFARGRRMNVYTHKNRIILKP